MKFCRHCGTQLADNAACNCPGAVAERQARRNAPPSSRQTRPAGQPQQPYHGNLNYRNAPGKTQPLGNSFGKKLIEPFTLLFKDPKKAVDNRIKDKDVATPSIYIGVLFTTVLAACNCIYGAHASKGILVPGDAISMGRGVVTYNFGLAFLAAFLLTVGMASLYAGARFLILLLCGKKGNAPVQLLLDSLISFGVNSVVPMGLILLGGLFYLISSMFGQVFFIPALFWYVSSCLLEIKDDLDIGGNPFLRLLIIAGVTGGAVVLFFLLYEGMFAMNVSVIAEYAAGYELRVQRGLADGSFFYY